MAERFRGHGRRLNDLLYVFIGAAIGAGVIFGGNYLRGVTGNAGDIGLMRVLLAALASAPKPDRAFDLLLTQTAINSLIRPLRGCGMSVEEQLDLGAAFERHREPVREWLEDFAQALLALSYRRPASSTSR